MKRTKIVDALKSTEYGKEITVKGWVRTHRSSKAVDFIALNDGSTIKNIQVVVDPAAFDEETLKQITTGACIGVTGTLVESPAQGQASEVQGQKIEIYGLCGSDYPMQKKGQSFEAMRKNAHMRLRTNTFGAVMRIRHNMAMAIHTYFHEHGFFYFHTPLITASDCEGAGNMFQVTTKNLYDLKKDEQGKIIYDDDFFGEQTSLTVSGQLEGELGATALGAIYTFGPTFRAENSNTPRHLAEFWMVEPEVAFIDQEELMDLEEDFIKYCVRWALDNCKDDLEFLNKMIDKTLIERLEGVLKDSFVRLPYTEGINILQEAIKNGKIIYDDDFFGEQTSLTVSGQLEGELGATALGSIYTFGPTFRAENSNTPRHLAEFWMVEPEVAFLDQEELMDLEEDFIKYCVRWALDNCKDDLQFLNQMIDKTLIERLEGVLKDTFVRLPYTEGINILQEAIKKGKKFEFPCNWGDDLASEHERYLVEEHFKKPVIMTDYPREFKSFYMKQNKEQGEGSIGYKGAVAPGPTMQGTDVLFPQIGEIIGGSVREESFEKLNAEVERRKMDTTHLWWYMDTRRWGSCPHAGFGLGFERLILFVTGMQNIRDVIPFPRTPKNAEF